MLCLLRALVADLSEITQRRRELHFKMFALLSIFIFC